MTPSKRLFNSAHLVQNMTKILCGIQVAYVACISDTTLAYLRNEKFAQRLIYASTHRYVLNCLCMRVWVRVLACVRAYVFYAGIYLHLIAVMFPYICHLVVQWCFHQPSYCTPLCQRPSTPLRRCAVAPLVSPTLFTALALLHLTALWCQLHVGILMRQARRSLNCCAMLPQVANYYVNLLVLIMYPHAYVVKYRNASIELPRSHKFGLPFVLIKSQVTYVFSWVYSYRDMESVCYVVVSSIIGCWTYAVNWT